MQQKGRRSAKEAAAVRRCRSRLPRSALEEKPSRSADGSVEGLLIDEKLGKQSVGERRGPQQQPETVSKAIPSAFPGRAIPLRRAPLPPAGSLGVRLNRISDNELSFLDVVSSPFSVCMAAVRVFPAVFCCVCTHGLSCLQPRSLCSGISSGQKAKYEFQIAHFEQLCRYLFIKHNK